MISSGASKGTESNSLTIGSLYLFLYNLAQAVGWTAIALAAIMHYSSSDSVIGLYADVKLLLQIFQSLAVLEVVHAGVGLVKSNPVLTGIQVASRVFLIWGVIYIIPEAQNQFGILLICIAWCVTEIIRYSFYMGALMQYVPYPIQYARYTLFIVLYPMGVTGEMTCIWHALPYVKEREPLSFSLPNAANISFSYYYMLIAILLSYIPLFPQLYCHMLAQRKKILGGDVKQMKKD